MPRGVVQTSRRGCLGSPGFPTGPDILEGMRRAAVAHRGWDSFRPVLRTPHDTCCSVGGLPLPGGGSASQAGHAHTIAARGGHACREGPRLRHVPTQSEVAGATAAHLVSHEGEGLEEVAQPADVGIEEFRGGLQGVHQQPGGLGESPGAELRRQGPGPGHAGFGPTVLEDPGSGQAGGGLGDHKGEPGGDGDRLDHFAATGADGSGGVCQEEGDVAAEPGSERAKLVVREGEVPEAGEAEQGGGGVGRAPGESRFEGNPFVQLDGDVEGAARFGGEQLRGPADQVAVIDRGERLRGGGGGGEVAAVQREPASRGSRGEPQFVEQVEGDHQRFEIVIAIGPTAEHLQREIELGGCEDGHAGGVLSVSRGSFDHAPHGGGSLPVNPLTGKRAEPVGLPERR